MNIFVVIVVYNKSCAESLTCKSLLSQTSEHIVPLIVDNSTRELHNGEYCATQGWKYHSMQGNAGLSKAYNQALDLVQPKQGDLVVWADDDTSFPDSYLSDLQDYAENQPDGMVFLPVVMSNKKIISPARYGKYHIAMVDSVDLLVQKNTTAINSGMAVRAEVYRDYRYNQKMFLDYIDHDFMRYCRTQQFPIVMMKNIILQQSFFADSHPQRSAALYRRKIFVKDFKLYSKACGCNPFITWLQLLKGRLRLELTCSRKGNANL